MTEKTIGVKICGLVEPNTLNTAIDSGARFVGFNFVPRSPRYLSPLSFAALSKIAHGRCTRVAVVPPTPTMIYSTLFTRMAPSSSGSSMANETPARCADIRKRYKIPILKALNAETRATIENWKHYPSRRWISLRRAAARKTQTQRQTILGMAGMGRAPIGHSSPRPSFLLSGYWPAASKPPMSPKPWPKAALFTSTARQESKPHADKNRATLIRLFIDTRLTIMALS